jgi:heat shock protein HslJ
MMALMLGGCTSIAADARTFEGTRWHVTAINGHSTPVSDRYSMSFEGGRISARFGCNSGGASYSVMRDVISAGPVMSTKMACLPATDEPRPGPMEFENMGFSVLGQPMRMTWRDSRHLSLANAAGSIELELLR